MKNLTLGVFGLNSIKYAHSLYIVGCLLYVPASVACSQKPGMVATTTLNIAE